MQYRKTLYSVNQSYELYLLLPGGAAAQSVESASLGEEVLGLIPTVADRSLLVAGMGDLVFFPEFKFFFFHSQSGKYCIFLSK